MHVIKFPERSASSYCMDTPEADSQLSTLNFQQNVTHSDLQLNNDNEETRKE